MNILEVYWKLIGTADLAEPRRENIKLSSKLSAELFNLMYSKTIYYPSLMGT